ASRHRSPQTEHLHEERYPVRRHGRIARPRGGAAADRRGCRQLALTRISIPPWQRRLLVACGAGAGMAAVYNVPLGGAVFALEVLLGTMTLPLVLPALATSTIATACAWLLLGNRPTYVLPSYAVNLSQVTWAVIV